MQKEKLLKELQHIKNNVETERFVVELIEQLQQKIRDEKKKWSE